MAPVSPLERVKSFLRLARFWNLLIIALAQYFTAAFLMDPPLVFNPNLFVLTVSTLMIAAAGYIINDYYDVKIDLINKPERVVVGRTISRRLAILLHSILSVSGIFLGFLVNWKVGLINFFSVFMLWLYSNLLKRLPFVGNLTIAILTGLSIIVLLFIDPNINVVSFDFARSMIPGWRTDIAPGLNILIFSMFAFFITLVREVIKDIEDVKGDNTFGCKTLPIVLGIRKTKNIIHLLTVVFVVSVLMVYKVFSVAVAPATYFSTFLLFLFAPVALLTIGLIRADTKRDFYRLSVLCKIIMLLGVFSMVLI